MAAVSIVPWCTSGMAKVAKSGERVPDLGSGWRGLRKVDHSEVMSSGGKFTGCSREGKNRKPRAEDSQKGRQVRRGQAGSRVTHPPKPRVGSGRVWGFQWRQD